jgi:HEPN domain
LPFIIDMATAARRNLDAAIRLETANHEMVAGYLFGIAAECAIKAMMAELHLSYPQERADDPRYAHFPELLVLLRDQMSGRRSGMLSRFIQDQRFLQGWSIKIRYSDGKNLTVQQLKSWSQQARDVVGLIGT